MLATIICEEAVNCFTKIKTMSTAFCQSTSQICSLQGNKVSCVWIILRQPVLAHGDHTQCPKNVQVICLNSLFLNGQTHSLFPRLKQFACSLLCTVFPGSPHVVRSTAVGFPALGCPLSRDFISDHQKGPSPALGCSSLPR